MSQKFVLLIVTACVVLLASPVETFAQKGWYANQALMRQQQMANQQRMMQQQRIARENQRRQAQIQRQQRQRQQQAMRAKQQRARLQMQQRQQAAARKRTAMLQRQKAAQRQRQKVVSSRQKTASKRTTTRPSGNLQRNALVQQRTLRQQRLAKNRTERLRKLRLQRGNQKQNQSKAKKENTALAFSAIAARSRTITQPIVKPKTAANFKQKRITERSQGNAVTKNLQKQRKFVQDRAKKLKLLAQKKQIPHSKAKTQRKDKVRKAAAKNHRSAGVENGKGTALVRTDGLPYGVKLGIHGRDRMIEKGVNGRTIDLALRKGKTFWDPKNKTVVFTLKPTSGKSIAVAVNPTKKLVTTVMKQSKSPIRPRFEPISRDLASKMIE